MTVPAKLQKKSGWRSSLTGAVATVTVLAISELFRGPWTSVTGLSAALLALPGILMIIAFSGVLGGVGAAASSAMLTLIYALSRLAFLPAGSTVEANRASLGLLACSAVISAGVVAFIRKREDLRDTHILSGTLRDIKDDHAQAMEGSELFNKTVLGSLAAQIAVLDRRGAILAVNTAWERFASENGPVNPATTGVGSNYLSVCQNVTGDHTEGADQVAEGISDVLDGTREQFNVEYPCHSPTQERWFMLTANPMRDNSGRITGAVVSHLNITDRRHAEAALDASNQQLRASRLKLDSLIANVPGVVWEAEGPLSNVWEKITFVSREVDRMTGFPGERWLNKPGFWIERILPDDRERALRDIAAIFGGKDRGVTEFRWITSSGRVIWVESHCSVVTNDTGQPVGMRGVTMDVTSRKRAQRALRERATRLVQLARQLKKTNTELDQFAYVTSHDLRAPLRGIANLSRWMEEDMADRFTPEGRRQMDLLRGRVQRMEGLIDGILEYSRVGRVKIRTEWIDVGALLAEVIDMLAPQPNVRVEVEPGMPTILTEKLRLQQVFLNLISNAIKYNDQPEPIIRVGCTQAGKLHEFFVQDNGPGIDAQYHEKIFVIFQTLQPRDKVEGTGVGLSLVKKIVESEGGRVTVDSTIGGGATFRFTWPSRPLEPAVVPASSEVTQSKRM